MKWSTGANIDHNSSVCAFERYFVAKTKSIARRVNFGVIANRHSGRSWRCGRNWHKWGLSSWSGHCWWTVGRERRLICNEHKITKIKELIRKAGKQRKGKNKWPKKRVGILAQLASRYTADPSVVSKSGSGLFPVEKVSEPSGNVLWSRWYKAQFGWPGL